MSGETLFPMPPGDDDARLIEAYLAAGRTLDDLPYTPEFDRVRGAFPGRGERELLGRLQTLRKAGRLPRVGRAATAPPVITDEESAMLQAMVIDAVGSLGRRDQLPYTPAFETLAAGFNARTARALEPHTLWRLIAKLAK